MLFFILTEFFPTIIVSRCQNKMWVLTELLVYCVILAKDILIKQWPLMVQIKLLQETWSSWKYYFQVLFEAVNHSLTQLNPTLRLFNAELTEKLTFR